MAALLAFPLLSGDAAGSFDVVEAHLSALKVWFCCRPPLVAATEDQKQELLQQQRHLSSQWSDQDD